MFFKPETFLKLIFPKGFFAGKILTRELDLKKEMMRAIIKATTVKKREVNATVYKVVDFYEKKMQNLKQEGVRAYKKQALNNEALLENRLENLVLYNEVQEMKKEHEGQFYRWLPSSAETPEPEHQLLYGKIFRVGEGDSEGNMPCERYGCKCGIEFLTAKEAEEMEGRLDNGI